MSADAERGCLQSAWPDEFADGARCAFHQRHPGRREPGGFPLGFHNWGIERKNAWYCGFTFGRLERQRALTMEAVNG
jgi:hypothetical protein